MIGKEAACVNLSLMECNDSSVQSMEKWSVCWVKRDPRTLGSLAKPLVTVKEGRARSQHVMGVVLSLEASIFYFPPGVKAFPRESTRENLLFSRRGSTTSGFSNAEKKGRRKGNEVV